MLKPALWHKDGDTLQAEEDDEAGRGTMNTGVYLLRAELSVGDRKTILESAVLQANNM
jgi:hypothetical protein